MMRLAEQTIEEKGAKAPRPKRTGKELCRFNILNCLYAERQSEVPCIWPTANGCGLCSVMVLQDREWVRYLFVKIAVELKVCQLHEIRFHRPVRVMDFPDERE